MNTTTKKKVLVIKSSEWYRRNEEIISWDVFQSGLYVPEVDRMCCLGLQLLQCGMTKQQLMGEHDMVDDPDYIPPPEQRHSPWYGSPSEIPLASAKKVIENGYPWLKVDDTYGGLETVNTYGGRETVQEKYGGLQHQAMGFNDSPGFTDEQRIEKLREIFAEVGWEIDWRPDE